MDESMSPRVYNVLFLCTGNSARSVMAEAILNGAGDGRFRAFSAGSHPTGKVNPFALEQIAKAGLATGGYRSKSWDELARPGEAAMDFVFTVCSDAAGEVCPIWPGHPMTAHWGVDDPAKHSGTDAEKQRVFALTYAQLSHRIRTFVSLPIEKLDRLALKKNLEDIGKY
jgi:protein-tyrosine-phosphatase